MEITEYGIDGYITVHTIEVGHTLFLMWSEFPESLRGEGSIIHNRRHSISSLSHPQITCGFITTVNAPGTQRTRDYDIRKATGKSKDKVKATLNLLSDVPYVDDPSVKRLYENCSDFTNLKSCNEGINLCLFRRCGAVYLLAIESPNHFTYESDGFRFNTNELCFSIDYIGVASTPLCRNIYYNSIREADRWMAYYKDKIIETISYYEEEVI